VKYGSDSLPMMPRVTKPGFKKIRFFYVFLWYNKENDVYLQRFKQLIKMKKVLVSGISPYDDKQNERKKIKPKPK